MAPITGFLGGLFGGIGGGSASEASPIMIAANGNALVNGKVQKYAYGGVVNRPTVFPMANGMGLMGEAGAEAILPLKRGSDGKLGVTAAGGGGMNVVVNVDASGSSVEGNEQEGRSLGLVLSTAITAEIIKQKRPGGLLA